MKDRTGFIIEFYHVGSYVKVSAVDPVTLKEVSIVGDPKRSEQELTDAAVKKLQFMLSKEKQ